MLENETDVQDVLLEQYMACYMQCPALLGEGDWKGGSPVNSPPLSPKTRDSVIKQ